jgi:hypothetical protein
VRVHRVAGSPGARSDQGAAHVHLDVGAVDLNLADRASVALGPKAGLRLGSFTDGAAGCFAISTTVETTTVEPDLVPVI